MHHFLCIDTETTGQDPSKHDIIDLAVIQYIDGIEVSRFSMLATPERSVSLGALKVNSTTPNDWTTNRGRYSQKELVTDFVDYLVKNVFTKKEKPTLLMHNGCFDLKFIESLLSRNSYEGFSEVVQWSIQDTSTIANFLMKVGKLDMSYISLEKLVKHFDIKGPFGVAHQASYDAEATWLVYNKLLELVK